MGSMDRRSTGIEGVRVVSEAELPRAEFEKVLQVTRKIVNAGLMDDSLLARSLYCELEELVHRLIEEWGDRPWLLETLADFHDDPQESHELYARASRLARARGEPCHTIHLSWVRLLLDDLQRPADARQKLLECEDDIRESGDESELREFQELLGLLERHR